MSRDYGTLLEPQRVGDGTALMETRLAARALSEGWPLSAEMRQRCVEEAFAILDDKTSTKYHKLGALRVIALWSRENAYLRRTQTLADTAELSAQTARLAAALKNPKYASLLDQLADDLSAPTPPALPEGQSPPPQGNTPSEM
jgi:hypothetical protein